MSDDKDNPDASATPEEVAAFFLNLHERNRQKISELLERNAAAAAANNPPPGVFSVGVDDFPEEAISLEDVTFLTSTKAALSKYLNQVPPAAEDGQEAAVLTMRRHALSLARSYLNGLALFLAADKSYHPNAPFVVNACGVFDVKMFNLGYYVQGLSESTHLAGALFPCVAHDVIPDELRVLQLAANLYFNALDNIFDLKAIRKCRIAFDNLMQTVGTPRGLDSAANYIRRHKTMYHKIVEWRTNGGRTNDAATHQAVADMTKGIEVLRQKVEVCTSRVDAVKSVVAKMDRRQTSFLKKLKVALFGFINLFRPGQPAPTREAVYSTFKAPQKTDEQKRYACLERLRNEAHKLQLKAVIDYTLQHPVVYESTNTDDFALSNAVRAVWNVHQKEWEKLDDAYDSFEKLKAACYNLRNKSDDPFTYQTR